MRPELSGFDVADVGRGYTIRLRNISAFHSSVFDKFSDFKNFFFGEFGCSVGFSNTLSAFRYFIGNVVRMCPKKKVIWVDAPPIVAFMANYKSFWDRAVCYFVGKSMDECLVIPECKPAVPIWADSISPLNAPSGGWGRRRKEFKLTNRTAKRVFSAADRKCFPTLFAF